MKIFVAGATGALGRRLVPMLVEAGHEVTGMTRTPAKVELLQRLGATPVVADALDADAVTRSVAEAAPDVVVHQLTALSGSLDPRHFDRDFAATNRLRTDGTDNLMAAARSAGARRFIAQSFAGWPAARIGGPVKTEDDPLDDDPPAAFRQTLAALRHLEQAVTGDDAMDGLVLRYGGFYGPGTTIFARPSRRARKGHPRPQISHRWRRRRRLVLHPRPRRGRRHCRGGGAGRAGRVQRRR